MSCRAAAPVEAAGPRRAEHFAGVKVIRADGPAEAAVVGPAADVVRLARAVDHAGAVHEQDQRGHATDGRVGEVTQARLGPAGDDLRVIVQQLDHFAAGAAGPRWPRQKPPFVSSATVSTCGKRAAARGRCRRSRRRPRR